jgi:glycosyltransferase involved in cell wall biosynthesis
VHNWVPTVIVDALLQTTEKQVLALRRSWDAEDETFVLGTVGRLVPEKGVDLLVRVFRLIYSRGDEPVRLVIVGGGAQRGEIEQLAGGDPRIVFAGAQENVAPFYCAFDAYASAARFEPFGLAILEAMAAGCPLVLTRSEGPREFVTDARVRWAEIDDEIAFAAQIVDSVALGRRRVTYDLKAMSQERAAEQIEALYFRAIKRRGK